MTDLEQQEKCECGRPLKKLAFNGGDGWFLYAACGREGLELPGETTKHTPATDLPWPFADGIEVEMKHLVPFGYEDAEAQDDD